MRKVLAIAGTALAFGLAGVALAQTELPEGVTDAQMNSAFEDLSVIYGAPIVRLDQAKAVCNEERYLVDCAEIGKKYDLFSDERTKQVNALLTEFKGDAVEKLKQCADVACLVEVATSIARSLNSGNPSVARAVELTPQKVVEKRTIVEAAKSLGVDIEACRTMDPDTATIELLRGCARLAKHENVQKYVPQATKDRAGGADAAIALKESLASGQLSCGDNTLEGCGNFCLAPSNETRASGIAGIPAVCRQIATQFFGDSGVGELERAYTTSQETFDTLTKRAQNVIFKTADGRTLSDPGSIGRYMEEAGARGDVEAVSRGMDFLIAKGFVTSKDRDFALSMVRKVKERGPVDFGACRADPSLCADLISEEERGQFTAMGEIEKIMRSEMATRGITDPSRCSSDPSAGQSCLEAARAALPQIERLAGESPQAQSIVSDIRQKIRFGEAGLEARSRVEERFKTTGDFSMGDRRFGSFNELEVFCRTNSQQCLSETARDGIFSRDVAEERYEYAIESRYNTVSPGDTQGRTPLIQDGINKEEALRQFKQWLDNPQGPPPVPPGADTRYSPYAQYPALYPQYQQPDPRSCQFATAMPIPCKVGEYRQESINELGCPVFGSCIPFSTKTEPSRLDGLKNICPALPTVASCPAGEEKTVAFSSPECGTYYMCRTQIDDQNLISASCERYGSGWRGVDSSGNCFGPSMTEYRTANGTLKSCATAPVYGCSSSDVPPAPPPSPSGQREQVWNNSGLRSWVRTDADATRIESLKQACANVSSQANIWLPTAGTQSSPDFGMPDPGKCAKAASCSSTQYFDGTACVASTPAQSCGYNEYWNGSACVTSTTQTGCTSGQYWDGSACVASTMTTGSCSSELMGLLGSGCHSMGGGWFNGEMTQYVLSGSQTVRSCTTEHVSGCTTWSNTQSCPAGQYWNSNTRVCESSTVGGGGMQKCFYPNATKNGSLVGYTVWCESDYVNCHEGSPSGASVSTSGLSLGGPSSCESGWSSGGSSACSSGQYWDGSACVTSTTSGSSACASGQYWDGTACQTTSTSDTPSTYDSTSAQESCASAGGTWDSAAYYCQMPSSDTSSEPVSYLFCPDGHDWNGAYCTLSPRVSYMANVWSAFRSLLGL
ncbi:MAG: hypothetical protein Q8P36_00680 [bacterium]|nr:hypothetical protein [bacterium]